jgi:hypothetical protein
MKLFISPTYTFTPGLSGAGTVNLSGIGSFDVKKLVSIINQTRGEVIYATGSASLKYTNVTGNTITLFYNTVSHSSLDTLQVIYDDPTALPVSGPLTDTQIRATALPVSLAAIPVGTGVAMDGTDITTPFAMPAGGVGIRGWLSAIWTKLNGSLAVTGTFWQTTQPVSIASMPSTPVTGTFFQTVQPISTTGKVKVNQSFNDYSVTPVLTSAYVQLVASTATAATMLEIFDSSGEAMILAVGAAASEVDQFYIIPGGNGIVELAIPAGSRISIKAKTATASVGLSVINLYL